MAKQAQTRDLYMQFFDMRGTYHATATQTLREFTFPTGISIRGMLMFLIHLVEVQFFFDGNTGTQEAAVSTRSGLAAMPSIGDDGLLWKGGQETTAGGLRSKIPHQDHYLPPVPLAAPQLSLYMRTGAHIAGLASDPVSVRLGFTTTPLDAAAYTEVAEVWGW